MPTLQKFRTESSLGSPRGTLLNCVVSGDVCELFNSSDRMCVKAATVLRVAFSCYLVHTAYDCVLWCVCVLLLCSQDQ